MAFFSLHAPSGGSHLNLGGFHPSLFHLSLTHRYQQGLSLWRVGCFWIFSFDRPPRSFMSHRLRGFLQTTSMLAGILFGLILFLFRGGISLNVVGQSSWFALPSPFLGVWPSFSLPAILATVCTYLAVMVNTVGSIQGISEIVGKEGLEDRIHRGIGLTGLGGLTAGFLGVGGLVSYSTSPGVVLVSRVASRYVLTMSGAIMILCAFIPKLWALLTVIPPSVIASVLFVTLSSQFMVGINVMLSGERKFERREYFTVGLPILLGTMVSIIPKEFFHLFPNVIGVFGWEWPGDGHSPFPTPRASIFSPAKREKLKKFILPVE